VPDAEPHVLIPDPIDPSVFADHLPLAIIAEIGGATMGTRWSARLALRDAGQTVALQAAFERGLAEIIAEMSTWEPASLICRFNRAPAGSWFTLPPMMFAVLDRALAIAAESDGAFDPTSGGLVDLWGFGPRPFVAAPDDAAIAALLPRVGWARIMIDRAAHRACQAGGVELDFSGIAKGFAVDRLVAIARDHGVHNGLIEIGGELRGVGVRPDGQPWWVDIEPPPGFETEMVRIALSGLCVATSGDYRRFHAIEGRRHGHTIDPRTGRPSDGRVVSATVIADDCMSADAYATALTVLGADAGFVRADALGLAAILFVADEHGGGETLFSARARGMLA
jgi:thiamine biosynthesis lipoprotein